MVVRMVLILGFTLGWVYICSLMFMEPVFDQETEECVEKHNSRVLLEHEKALNQEYIWKVCSAN